MSAVRSPFESRHNFVRQRKVEANHPLPLLAKEGIGEVIKGINSHHKPPCSTLFIIRRFEIKRMIKRGLASGQSIGC